MTVTFGDAQSWYVAALDGLRVLELAIHDTKSRPISEETLEKIFGMSVLEWKDFLKRREEEHELFASLAVLASFEGHVRRDAELRSAKGSTLPFASKFSGLEAAGPYLKLSTLFGTWEAALGNSHFLRPTLSSLRELYRDRNRMAHGKARRGDFAFEPIYEKLSGALTKWREFDPYFGRR